METKPSAACPQCGQPTPVFVPSLKLLPDETSQRLSRLAVVRVACCPCGCEFEPEPPK
ncbi:MAG: hypothetical protein SFU86_12850 [Pirellulaceae bacterium]|nr:hypothetical protein [Pirellulaceae bacterium]